MHPAGDHPRDVLGPLDFPRLRTMLHERTGILLEEGTSSFVTTRLAALAVEQGFEHLPRLLESLHTEDAWGPLHRRVLETLAVSETSFFRDLHPFEALRNTIVPRLIRDRADRRLLRFWCAACATGQEPYSLAMLLRQNFHELAAWRVEIFASDFSTTVLRRAREGRFTQVEVNRGLPAAMLLRYFEKDGPDWRVRDEIRSMVTFRDHNLVNDPPVTAQVDVVLLRNVLIYFDQKTRIRVLAHVARSMNPDGVLIMGAGESFDARDAGLELESVDRTSVLRPSSSGQPRCLWFQR